MRLYLKFYFLTLVLFFCFFQSFLAKAYPLKTIPPEEVSLKKEALKPFVSFKKRDLILKESKGLLYGFWGGPYVEKDEGSQINSFWGMSYTKYQVEESALDYHLLIDSRNRLALQFGKKHFCCLGEYSDPYYKIAFGGIFLPEEGLASFIDYKHYQFILSGGFEDLFKYHRKIRTEFSLALGTVGLSYLFHLNYSWGE